MKARCLIREDFSSLTVFSHLTFPLSLSLSTLLSQQLFYPPGGEAALKSLQS